VQAAQAQAQAPSRAAARLFFASLAGILRYCGPKFMLSMISRMMGSVILSVTLRT
jgi:hypothetical protein